MTNVTKTQWKAFNLNSTLSVSCFDDQEIVYGLEPTQIEGKPGQFSKHPRCPELQQHLFDSDYLLDFADWYLAKPDRELYRRAFYAWGDPGCGKTSGVEQFAARTNQPVIKVSCHPYMEEHELFGKYLKVGGNTVWVDGPVTLAWKRGYLLLLDEVDRLNPEVTPRLHGVLEGRPLDIPGKDGESIVKRHPLARICATGNTANRGDSLGLHAGAQSQSSAFINRFVGCHVKGLSLDKEVDMLAQRYPKLATPVPVPGGVINSFVHAMVSLAHDVRNIHLSKGGELDAEFSTRTLTVWGDVLTNSRRHRSFEQTLSYVLTGMLQEPMHVKQINDLATDHFGDLWTQQVNSGKAVKAA